MVYKARDGQSWQGMIRRYPPIGLIHVKCRFKTLFHAQESRLQVLRLLCGEQHGVIADCERISRSRACLPADQAASISISRNSSWSMWCEQEQVTRNPPGSSRRIPRRLISLYPFSASRTLALLLTKAGGSRTRHPNRSFWPSRAPAASQTPSPDRWADREFRGHGVVQLRVRPCKRHGLLRRVDADDLCRAVRAADSAHAPT